MSGNPYLATSTVTIANGASLSDAAALGGLTALALQLPAAWTTAVLTLQGSADGVTYGDVYKEDGTEYTIAAAAARVVTLDPGGFSGLRYLKLRSGTAATPVNQGAARAIVFIIRPV